MTISKIVTICSLLLATTGIFKPSTLHAQSAEERFQDVFITAGYATAFGAALGAAALGLQHNPEKNLKFIAIGASLGFIGGSLMGAYMVFTPVMADAHEPSSTTLLSERLETGKVYIRPHIGSAQNRPIAAIEGAMTLWTF